MLQSKIYDARLSAPKNPKMSAAETSAPQPGEAPDPEKCSCFLKYCLCQPRRGVRYYQYAVMFLTLIISSGIHASLSVAIVAMTGEEPPEPGIQTYTDWTNPDVILSAFFWASFIPQVSGSKLSKRCGPKWVLLMTMLIGAVFNIVLPSMAHGFGSNGVIVCRVLQGLCQGFLHPSIESLIQEWSPLSDRSRVSNIIYSGATLGVAICMPLAGVIVGSQNGWPAVFYVYGTMSIVWCFVVAIFIANSPSVHTTITESELRYLKSDETDEEPPPTPWVPILKSRPVWAILVAGSAHCWGSFTLLTQIPTYMYLIMNFDISENGDVSALPYVAQLVIGLITVVVTDKIIDKRLIDKTKLRKILTSLGLFLPAVFLLTLAFLDSSQRNAATGCLIVAVGTSVVAQSGYYMNVIDLAPNHSGTLFACVNVTTTVFSILGPLTVGFLGDDKKDPLLWRNVFLISTAIYVACGIFYIVFASSEVQLWNWKNEEEPTKSFYQRFLDLKEQVFSFFYDDEFSLLSFCNCSKIIKCNKNNTSEC